MESRPGAGLDLLVHLAGSASIRISCPHPRWQARSGRSAHPRGARPRSLAEGATRVGPGDRGMAMVEGAWAAPRCWPRAGVKALEWAGPGKLRPGPDGLPDAGHGRVRGDPGVPGAGTGRAGR